MKKLLVLTLLTTTGFGCAETSTINSSGLKTEMKAPNITNEVSWKIGGKIHFEEQSSVDYIGTIEINELTRKTIKDYFDIKADSCACNAKVLIKKENDKILITHREEKSKPGIGEEMHATLLYTSKRVENGHETLRDIYDNLRQVDDSLPPDKAPAIEQVANVYQKVIKPDWKFQIVDVEFISGITGSGIIAKLQLDGRDEILNNDGNPISGNFLHLSLAMVDSSMTPEMEKLKLISSELKNKLSGKMVKIGNRSGQADLEFGISGSADRIRPQSSSKEIVLSEDIRKFYETGVEKDRLYKKMGRLEKARTDEILSKYLPKPPATILDVGGGMGAYSFDLARKGYDVYLIDPVAANIAEAKKTGKGCNGYALKGYIAGDARKIELADQSADVVLFFGPLYHLDPSDRQIALREAYRVLKPGGKLFAAAVSKFAPIPGSFLKGRMEDPEVEQAVFDSLKKGQFFYRGGIFYSHYPEELKHEIEKAGFENVSAHAIEGFGAYLDNSNWDNETVRQKLLAVIEQTETEPSLLGVSSHLMAIGQKPL